MANSNKRKGDRAEREAVAVLCRLAPDLVVPRPQRLLGAGRREDTGDLWVLPGVTVQVKHRADPAHGDPARRGRSRGAGAAGRVRRSRWGWCRSRGPGRSAVRWVACCAAWPGRPPADVARVPQRDPGAAPRPARRQSTAPPRTTGWRWSTRAPTAALFLATARGVAARLPRRATVQRGRTGPDRPG